MFYPIDFIYVTFKKSKTIGTENRPVVTRGWGGCLTTKGKHKGSVSGEGTIVCADHDSSSTGL